MGLNCRESSTLEPKNTAVSVWAGIYAWPAMPHKFYLLPEASLWEFEFKLYTVLSAVIKCIAIIVEVITTGLESNGMIPPSVGNILHIYWSINEVLSKSSTARVSKNPNQVTTQWSPMRINNGMMPSTLTASRLTVCICGDLTDLMDSSKPCVRKSFCKINSCWRPYRVD